MAGILLTIHIIVSVGLVVSILLQRSEGGLGGLGGGMSNVMAPESGSNFITKLTSYLAAGFILTSISLAVVSSDNNSGKIIIENDNINKIDKELNKNEPTVPLAE